jgi:type I restriction enzyme S subunit
MKQGNALNLPKGWESKRIEDCFKLKSGDGLTSKMMSEDGIYPVFGGNGIAGLHNKFNLSGSNVIIGRVGALCGNVRHMNEKIWLTDNAFRIVDFKYDFDHSFLTYLLNFKNLREFARQAAQPVISNSSLKDVTLEFPKSLPEQQRIVAILDEAFAAIAKAKANAEQNLKNAKELFESYLQGVFNPSLRSGQGNKDEGWEEKRFDEICVLQRGFDLPTHSRNEGSYPLVSSNGITDRIDLWKVKSPGVVTGRSGTIGNVHYIEEDYWPLNTALYIKEFHGNYERFIYFFLKQFDLGKYSSGAGVPTLNRNNVHSEMVWFPKSIKFQQVIVQKLDTLSTEIKKLEAIYQQKIKDLEELKKSVLQKAFSGELRGGVPVEPKTKKLQTL